MIGSTAAGRGGAAVAALVGILAVAVLAVWCVARLEVATDITHFLPEGELDPDVALARELALGELSRTLIAVVGTGDPAAAAAVSRDFEAELRATAPVAEACIAIEGGPPEGLEQDLWNLYEPRPFAFFARDVPSARAALTDRALAAQVADLRRRLALPMSSLLTRVAPGDPFLTLPALLERLEHQRGAGLDVSEGRFVIDGGASAVLFLTTRAPVSDNRAQRPFLDGVQAAFERLDAARGGGLTLETAGANRYGVRMERSIKADIRRVTIGSSLLLVLLFAVLFRSLRLFALVLPVLGTGFLAGVAACLTLFGSVHGLTLAFGAALIGVSVDYAVHFHCHHVLSPDPGGPRRTMASIWPALWLGAATTVMGFVALAVSSFPGLRELAVFAASGITAALFATRAFLPALAGPSGGSAASRTVARGLARVADPVARRRPIGAGLVLVAAAAVTAVGLPRATWEDSVAALNRLDADLLAEDERVRSRLSGFDSGRLVVAVAADEQAALEINDAVADALSSLAAAGAIEGSWSAATLLPSAARQTAVDRAVRGDGSLWPRTVAVLEDQGFVASAFEPFRRALAAPPPPPLVWDDLASSALGQLVRPLRVTLPTTVLAEGASREGSVPGFVSFVRGVADEAALAAAVASAGGRLVDIEGDLTRAYAEYRRRMSSLLALGAVGVVLLVALRYAASKPRSPGRILRATVAACLPAFLAAAATVAILALCGLSLNLVSLVALLMVASMGVDYGVFLVAAAGDRRAFEATLLAVVVAGLSTVFGFGLLALSDQPMLQSIGATAGIGVLLCLVLVPTMNRIARPSAEPIH